MADRRFRLGRKRRMRWALLTIGTACTNFTRGRCSDEGSGRTPDCDFTAGRWCDQCIAREGLHG